MTLAIEKVQKNKKLSISFAEQVIHNKAFKSKTIGRLNFELSQTRTLSEAIFILTEIKDKRNNIDWYIEHDVLVRDGRNAKTPPVIPIESYIVQYLNHVRAAISITKNPKLNALLEKEALNKISKFLQVESADDLAKIIIKENTKLSKKLIEHKIPNAEKKIRLAKDFCNLKDKHYHIVTLSKIEQASVIEAEIMNLALTDSQRKMFKAINTYFPKDEHSKIQIDVKDQDMSWFNKLPRWKQDLVKKYSGEILKEDHVIPTQLRDILPVLRNSYTKVTAVMTEKDKHAEEILESLHSGSISTNTLGNNLSCTMGNINQLKLFSPHNSLHLNILLSPINFFDADRKDNKLILKAITNIAGVIKTTAPFNFLRKYFFNGGIDLSGSIQTLNEIGDKLPPQLASISSYLKTGKDFNDKEVEKELALISSTKTKNALSNAIDTMHDIVSLKKKTFRFKKDIENTNSRISVNMKLISYAANKGYLGKKLKNLPIVNTYCKSGKDRTQMIENGSTIKAIEQKFNIRNTKEKFKIIKSILAAQHSSHMAGVQGGSLGCYGIRRATVLDANALIFGKETHDYIALKTASYNKFKINSFELSKAKVQKNLESIKRKLDLFFTKPLKSKSLADKTNELLKKRSKTHGLIK